MNNLYFLATLHPTVNKSEEEEGFLNLDDKRKVIEDFYREKQDIPLCIKHGSGNSPGYKVTDEERAGKVVDMFNDENGCVIAKCVIPSDNRHYIDMNKSIMTDKSKWGVSIWLDIYYDEYENKTNNDGGGVEDATPKPSHKKLTHVALTPDPFFADRGSFIHHWSLDEKSLNGVINREYYIEGLGHCYATNEFKEKIKHVPTPPPLTVEEKQQQQQQTENEVQPPLIEKEVENTLNDMQIDKPQEQYDNKEDSSSSSSSSVEMLIEQQASHQPLLEDNKNEDVDTSMDILVKNNELQSKLPQNEELEQVVMKQATKPQFTNLSNLFKSSDSTVMSTNQAEQQRNDNQTPVRPSSNLVHFLAASSMLNDERMKSSFLFNRCKCSM
jgi:hypothetical protein